MSRKVPLWMFVVSIALNFVGFELWGKSNLDHYEQEYGLHAEAFFSKVRVLELLNQNKVNEAVNILQKETEGLGVAVALCLMNECSKEAQKVSDEFKTL